MNNDMLELNRLTTRYDAKEDRLCLIGEIKHDQAVILWLSQRLINRVVPLLCQKLEKTQTLKQSASSVVPNLKQSFAQQRARTELPKQVPVNWGDCRDQWLIQSIHLKSRLSSLCLIFKGELPSEQAQLVLSRFQLRQWMNIVHDQYRIAGWAMGVWPLWMDESRSEKNQISPVLH